MGTAQSELAEQRGTMRGFVTGKVLQLQRGLLEMQSSKSKADAARLRRALDRPAGSVPEVWQLTLDGLPESFVGRADNPSPAETAAHTALCLYSLHQQSQSTPMHITGRNLGRALRDLHMQLAGEELEGGPLIRRFNALSTADSVVEMHWHLRSLVTQLRGKGIPLDYGLLANDLYRFSNPDFRDGVRLNWGRGFYASPQGLAEKNPVDDESIRNAE